MRRRLLIFGTAGAGGGGRNWLFLDRFLTDRTAGNVDGTAAEPGPGTRTVTDTGSAATITSGEFKITAVAGPRDPWLRYVDVPVTRAAGVMSRMYFKATNLTTERLGVGLINTLTTPGFGNVIGFKGFATTLIAGAGDISAGRQVAGYVNGTGIDIYIILRAAGAFLLVDGNLLWIDRAEATATLYASVLGAGGSDVACDVRADNIGPAQLSITDPALFPIPTSSDGFDRANGAIGSTDGAGHQEGVATPQGAGIAWENAGTWTVAANVATNTPVGAADNLCYTESGNAEVLQAAKVTRSGGEVGIVINVADTSNFISVVHDGTNVITTEVVAGTPNVLSTVAKAYAADAYIEARRIANEAYIFYNGAFVAALTPNVALQSNTKHGLYSDTAGNTIDDAVTWPATVYNHGAYA